MLRAMRQVTQLHIVRQMVIVGDMSTMTVAPPQRLTAEEAVGMAVNQQLFAHRLTAADLGRMLGFSRATASRKLRGKIGWTVTDLLELSRLFGVTVEDLMPRRDGEGYAPAPFRVGCADADVLTLCAHRGSNPGPAD